MITLYVIQEFHVEGVASQRGTVTNYHKFSFCPGQGDIYPPGIGKKAYLPFGIGPDQADHNDVSFLALKGIDGIYGK